MASQRRTARRASGSGARGQLFGIGWIDGFRQLIEQVGIVTQQAGLASEHRHEIALGERIHCREQLVAHSIAQKGRVAIGRIVDNRDVERGSRGRQSSIAAGPGWAGADLGASPPDRVLDAPRMRFRSTVSAWSSAVWPVMTSVGSTAYRASRALASWLGPSPTSIVRETERRTEPGCGRGHHCGLDLGAGAEAMVDVYRRHDAACLHGQDHQRHRVGAS